jgi:catechol 2,3-dioxygenase-like lactoylglutathione lyase family enzyme
MGIDVAGVCTLFQVFDMSTSFAFYRDILGFRVVHFAPSREDCDWCRLKLGHTELMLNTQFEKHERPTQIDRHRITIQGDACLYFECSSVDAAYEHLTSNGIDVEAPFNRDYGMRQLYVVDPDDYGLCFQCPIE